MCAPRWACGHAKGRELHDSAPLLRLLAWLSPAFPTGAYAYSHGLEWAVESGDISRRRHPPHMACRRRWRTDPDATMRSCCATRTALHTNAATLHDIAELAAAVAPSRERRMETLDQGTAFIAAAAAWHPPQLPSRVAYPVAVGALAGQPRHPGRHHRCRLPSIICGEPDFRRRAPRPTRPEHRTARARRVRTDDPAHRRNNPHRHAGRSWRLRLPLRPRRHAPRNPVHEAVPLMTASTNGPLRIGIGGPVGTGKTALMDALCKRLREMLRHRRDHQ